MWLVSISFSSISVSYFLKIVFLIFMLISYTTIFLGNMKPDEAESMIQHVEGVFFEGPRPKSKPLFPSQHLTNRIVKLKRAINYFYPIEGLNQSDENSALVHYIQVRLGAFSISHFVRVTLYTLQI